jgi:hypothetical protein
MTNTRRWASSPDDAMVDAIKTGVGQKLAALAVVVYCIATVLTQQWQEFHLSLYLAIWGMVMSMMAVWLVGKGLDFPLWGRLLALLCLFIPFANMMILISLSVRATSALRAAGYDVGLFGAR